MAWCFSVAPPDDPAGCRAAAATLRAVAVAALDAADVLAAQVALPRAGFAGMTARAYRSAAHALEVDARGAAIDVTALADALETYAHEVAAVRRTLARVRRDAVAAGLVVTPDDAVLWPPAPTTDPDRAYQRLAAVAAAARADLAAAYAAWWDAVQMHTKGPLPSRVTEGADR